MIQMNGLGQAVAFYRMKSRDHEGYKKLYELLSEWLTKTGKPYEKYNDLLEGITQSDMYTYRLAQAEALVLLDWVKKFAKAYCVDDKNPEPGNAA
jgi:CRISPR-associated protein Cmr5